MCNAGRGKRLRQRGPSEHPKPVGSSVDLSVVLPPFFPPRWGSRLQNQPLCTAPCTFVFLCDRDLRNGAKNFPAGCYHEMTRHAGKQPRVWLCIGEKRVDTLAAILVNPSYIYLSAMGCLWLLDDCCGLSSVRQMRVIVKPPSFSPRFPVFLPDKLSARLDFASSYIWPRCIVSPFVTSSHCQNKNPASQNSGRKIKTIGTAEAK